MITEAYTNLKNLTAYYGNSSSPGAHLPFNFLMITDVGKESDAKDLKNMIESWYQNMPEFGWANWVVSHHLSMIIHLESHR